MISGDGKFLVGPLELVTMLLDFAHFLGVESYAKPDKIIEWLEDWQKRHRG